MPYISDMHNIKQYLSDVGISQKELAERIGLSRPTLNTYIELFESGKTIPKERYNIIFDRLFDNENCSAETFFKNLSQVEKLIARDQKYGISDLKPEEADLVSLIIRNMNRDLKIEGYDKDVYVFINMLLLNYRKNEIFKQLVEYFIYLNDIRDIDTIEESQIPYFANIYKAFHSLTINPCVYEEQDYQDFIKRCSEVQEENKKWATERENNLKRRIRNMIAEYEKKGVILNEEEIIEELTNQVAKERINNERS